MSFILDNEQFQRVNELIKMNLEDIQRIFKIEENLYEKYILPEIYSDPITEDFIVRRQTGALVTLGGSGTLSNMCILYSLVRHYGFLKTLETGVDSGFSTYFFILAAQKNKGQIVSIDILTDPRIAEYPLQRFGDCENWNLIKGVDSLEQLKKMDRSFGLYSHDSLHKMYHMLKELDEFKKCELDRFVVFFDDQNSDNFWDFCLRNNLFKKKGYRVSFIKRTNVRFYDHMGGFILYEKE